MRKPGEIPGKTREKPGKTKKTCNLCSFEKKKSYTPVLFLFCAHALVVLSLLAAAAAAAWETPCRNADVEKSLAGPRGFAEKSMTVREKRWLVWRFQMSGHLIDHEK